MVKMALNSLTSFSKYFRKIMEKQESFRNKEIFYKFLHKKPY